MKPLGWIMALLLAVGAAPVHAGPTDSPIPTNPCGVKPLKLVWVADGVGTDAGGTACPGAGAGCQETMVVCYNAGKTGAPAIDIAVELFDASGSSVTSPLACQPAVAAGASASFVTTGAALPAPYVGTTLIAGTPAILGSLRVMSTSPGKTVCDVTVMDSEGIALFTTKGPAWSKGVAVTKKKASQKGD